MSVCSSCENWDAMHGSKVTWAGHHLGYHSYWDTGRRPSNLIRSSFGCPIDANYNFVWNHSLFSSYSSFLTEESMLSFVAWISTFYAPDTLYNCKRAGLSSIMLNNGAPINIVLSRVDDPEGWDPESWKPGSQGWDTESWNTYLYAPQLKH